MGLNSSKCNKSNNDEESVRYEVIYTEKLFQWNSVSQPDQQQ